MIYWELLDFDFSTPNIIIMIFLDILCGIITYKVLQDLKKRKYKLTYDTIHFYCILIAVT